MMKQPLLSAGEAGVMIGEAVTWPPTGQGLGGAIRAEVEHIANCNLTGGTIAETGVSARPA